LASQVTVGKLKGNRTDAGDAALWCLPARTQVVIVVVEPVEISQSREIRTAIPGPRSLALAARRKAALPAGVGATMPIFAERAYGGIVVDVDGNSFIDLGGGIAVLNVGSSAPLVVEAVNEQVQRFTHTCFQVTGFESYITLAERLNALVPGTDEKRSFFVNSGAEAVENAVKIARSFTGRQAVVVFDHAFHGRTLLTMSLTAKAMPYKSGFGPFAPEVYRVPFSNPYRCAAGAAPEQCGEACADMAIAAMDKQIGGNRIACVLLEPVQGEGGVIIPGAGFLPRLSEYCKEHGIVFIADEVQAGMARTGKMFSSEHFGIVPDLITTAKGLGGGLPIGGITGRADVMDAVHPGGLGSTFGGNPVSCAAALGALSEIESRGLVERAQHIGEIFESRLMSLAEQVPAVGEVRVIGAMAALEFVTDPATKEPDPVATSKVLAACHAEGIILLKAGTYDNIVRLLPPLVISDDLLNDGLSVLEKAVRAL
jgi:4-aminobutyrate aminotransferase/(S)-3-amino-2-methylpropionate transaminase